MKLSISARIVLGFVLVLVILLVIGGASYRNLTGMREDMRSVQRTLEVLQHKASLLTYLFEAQSIARGHALAADPTGLERFRIATENAQGALQSLRALTADNVQQQQRLDRVEPLIRERLATARELFETSAGEVQTSDHVTRLVQEGRDLSVALSRLTAEIEAEERQLLQARERNSAAAQSLTTLTMGYGTTAAFVLVVLVSTLLTRSIRMQLRGLLAGATRLAAGDYSNRVQVCSADEVGELALAFNAMAAQIEERQNTIAADGWLKNSLARLSSLFESERKLRVLGPALLKEASELLQAQHAALYVRHEQQQHLDLLAAYAADEVPERIELGRGLIGQAFRDGERLVLTEVPDQYVRISSALGQAPPRSVVIMPAMRGGDVRAVIELASLHAFTELQLRFLEQLAGRFALVLTTIQAGNKTEELLAESQALTEELQAQSERLRESEQRLKVQQEELKQTNEELEQANEELQQANEEMEERAALLAEQKVELERSNLEVEEARRALERQSAQLAQTSKYKSEFLANMSHELRTPLNSLLILSNVLAENLEGNLTPKQVQHARTVHASGSDLLELINEILDLSKIEAGAIDLEIEDVRFDAFQEFIENTFRPIAGSKGLRFAVHRDPELGDSMCTDLRRLEQVVKNLVSNALKFTHEGSVELRIRPVAGGWNGAVELLDSGAGAVAFEVRDTGIGIAPQRLQQIFEPFQQAESGTSRKYGGTGLGLAISRDLAQRLGGALQVASEPGKGSVFTLYLPRQVTSAQLTYLGGKIAADAGTAAYDVDVRDLSRRTPLPEIEPSALADDRESIQPGDLTLLAIEDDVHFAQVIAQFARDRGFKVLLAQTAGSGMALARRVRPTAITLDLRLPDADGRMVLDFLKHDPSTRHIPVHVISVDDARERMLRAGAVSFLHKPVTKEALENALERTVEFVRRPMKRLLIVEDDDAQRHALVELIGEGDVCTVAVGTAKAALAEVTSTAFDCIVVDLMLPDQSGIELIEAIHRQLGAASPPVIVYTAKTLSRQEETQLRRLSEAIILKDVRSPERLLDETALFLHRVQARLPEPKRKLLEQVQRDDPALSGRKVLVVDDDVRNIFAITTALESYRMEVIYAESGRAGIEQLEANPDVNAVLMDVMMPEMDGFEATQRIRRDERFRNLPIIMVTAKAMKGDREKCLAAGASDYITKPVDMDQLRSLLRVWLYR